MSALPVPVHPWVAVVAGVRARLGEVAEVNPTFMRPHAQALVMEELAAARAQLEELELRVMAACGAGAR